jgi:hypothetical protein
LSKKSQKQKMLLTASLLLLPLTQATPQPHPPHILTHSKSNNCLLQTIHHLKPHCDYLDDATKREMTVRFSNCVLEAAGKRNISCFERDCVKGMGEDQWTVYSSYVVHIDSLCHYYKQIDWEENALGFVNRLLEASVNTSSAVKETLAMARVVSQSH